MSHEEQIDLRIRRTHKFLQEAMIELITENGFDALTVGDIAERAMINRATFYRHYQVCQQSQSCSTRYTYSPACC